MIERVWLELYQLLEVAHVELPLCLKLNNVLEVGESWGLILYQDHIQGNVKRILEFVKKLELICQLQCLLAVLVNDRLRLNLFDRFLKHFLDLILTDGLSLDLFHIFIFILRKRLLHFHNLL